MKLFIDRDFNRTFYYFYNLMSVINLQFTKIGDFLLFVITTLITPKGVLFMSSPSFARIRRTDTLLGGAWHSSHVIAVHRALHLEFPLLRVEGARANTIFVTQ